jgi:hypothetical protein
VDAGFVTEVYTIIAGNGDLLTTGSVLLQTGSELVYGGICQNNDRCTVTVVELVNF